MTQTTLPMPYLIQGDNIVIFCDNEPHTVNKSHLNYNTLLNAIRKGEWDSVKDVVSPARIIVSWAKGDIEVDDVELKWRGEVIHNSLSARIITMIREGFDAEPMINFLINLIDNPSKRSVDELYGFLEKNSLPITPDGHFLAYKKVRDNYFDVHSGTFDNSVGNVVKMRRNQVNEDKDQTCSSGLHFCSFEYLKSFGGQRTMVLKINPRDVVSITSDYNNSKGRCCEYTVIGEVGVSAKDEFTQPVQDNGNSMTSQAKKQAEADCGYDYYTDEDDRE